MFPQNKKLLSDVHLTKHLKIVFIYWALAAVLIANVLCPTAGLIYKVYVK